MTDVHPSLSGSLSDRYQIHRELGRGGMATVYLAEDVRHHRRVALKILHSELTAVLGSERFLREIELTASMQHPHILPLFDSGEADGQLFYVMPFVDGETLRARLKRETQLPVDDALRIAREVADALDYAHGRGIVHRDIKPENILLQGGHALVTDFGIALAVQRAGDQRITQTGLSLGTPQYMAPEQAMGDKVVDQRADLYALGAVVYEMLTGEPPFTGPSAQAIIARVLTAAPVPPTLSRATIPAHVEAAVLTALAKLPADRFASARDFAEALSGARPVSARPSRTSDAVSMPVRRRVAVAAAPWVVAVATTAIAAWSLGKPDAVVPMLTTFTVDVPDTLQFGTGFGSRVAISPDGSEIVFALRTSTGSQMLYGRRMDDTVLRPIRGTDGASGASFTRDGRSIVFIAELPPRGFVVPSSGGTARQVAPDASGGLSATADGRIVSADVGGLWIQNADGSNRRLVLAPDSARGVLRLSWPDVLPGSSHTLVTYWRSAIDPDSTRLAVVSLSDGHWEDLGTRGLSPHYAPPGFIVFARSDSNLFSIPFSLSERRVRGTPVRLVDEISVGVRGAASTSVSSNGTLVTMPAGDPRAIVGMYAVDQHGAERKTSIPSAMYLFPRIAPDGRHVAVSLPDPALARTANAARSSTVVVYDLAAGTASRLFPDSNADRAEWSADGSRLYFRQQLNAGATLWSRPWDLSAPPRIEARARRHAYLGLSIGPSRGFAAIRNEVGPSTIRIARIDSLQNAHTLLEGNASFFNPKISSSGTLLAYSSDETKRTEVYVTPIPGPGPRLLVSVDGGSEPVWSRDGTRLFYRSGTTSRSGDSRYGYLIAASIVEHPTLTVARRDTLFRDIYTRSETNAAYDVFPDGRLLMLRPPDLAGRERLAPVVIMNW